MESKDELKETDIKNRTCYCFDDILRFINFGYNNISFDHMKIFWFMTFHANILWLQNHYVFNSKK